MISAISRATQKLQSGDTLFVTYSGHGGQVPDEFDEEKDRLDETWVLNDRQLLDDKLYTLWGSSKLAYESLSCPIAVTVVR